MDIEGLVDEAMRRHNATYDVRPDDVQCVKDKLALAVLGSRYLNNGSPDSLQLAGCFLFYLIQGNCFIDGNKRVGWLAATDLLYAIGIDLAVSDDDAEAFCLKIASGLSSREEAIEWLAFTGKPVAIIPPSGEG